MCVPCNQTACELGTVGADIPLSQGDLAGASFHKQSNVALEFVSRPLCGAWLSAGSSE